MNKMISLMSVCVSMYICSCSNVVDSTVPLKNDSGDNQTITIKDPSSKSRADDNGITLQTACNEVAKRNLDAGVVVAFGDSTASFTGTEEELLAFVKSADSLTVLLEDASTSRSARAGSDFYTYWDVKGSYNYNAKSYYYKEYRGTRCLWESTAGTRFSFETIRLNTKFGNSNVTSHWTWRGKRYDRWYNNLGNECSEPSRY